MAGFQFSWTIREYSKLTKTGSAEESPVFEYVRDNFHSEWQIILYPCGFDTGDRDDTFDYEVWTSLYLKMVSCNCSAVQVKFKMWFHLVRNAPLFPRERSSKAAVNFVSMKRWGWMKMMSNEHIRRHSLDSDDSVTILCEFEFLQVIGELQIERPYNGTHNFSQIWNFYAQGKFTDFTIVVAGGKEFRLHKVLVAALSPVIAAMFDHDTQERAMNRLELSDFDSETVEKFVNFVYNGRVFNFGDKAKELLVFADKYDIKPLMLQSEQALLKDIKIKNVLSLLQFADIYNAKSLKKLCLEFIKQNIEAVMTHHEAEWDSLPPSLTRDFVKSLFPTIFN